MTHKEETCCPSLSSRAHLCFACVRLCAASELPYARNDEEKDAILSIITHALQCSLHPIVFMVTTEHEATASEHMLEKTFGQALLQHPKVQVIKCNPISNTELIKAIRRVIESEQQQRASRTLYSASPDSSALTLMLCASCLCFVIMFVQKRAAGCPRRYHA